MPSPPAFPFAINPALDRERIARDFAQGGRVRIAGFLADDGAARLRQALRASTAWRHVINGETRVFEIDAAQYDALPPAERGAIEQAVHTAAASGFQFRFDTIRVADDAADRRRSASILDAFALFMSSADVLAFVTAVTGVADIAFADAQATRYRPGHFLTGHDDDVAGKDRRLAYVLGLTPEWRVEHGGLLHFHGRDGGVVETMAPGLNSLCLFAVGQSHSVSIVAPFAPAPRLSVTGWLRARPPGR